MPIVSGISLFQFKNYSNARFSFTKRVVGICGLNGKGKTNLLDAIYYCCFTKSYFSNTDAANVQFNQEGFRIEGLMDGHKVVCILRENGKKEVLLDDVPYTRFSEHIGRFPAVMVAPDDVELITGSGSVRRKYMDTLLSQVDAGYLQQLIVYNKVLQQRNSLLKEFADSGRFNASLLEVLDEQLAAPGTRIHTRRQEFLQELIPLVQHIYGKLSEQRENTGLVYESQLNECSFKDLLAAGLQKDRVLQRTGTGIHKDDIRFLLNGQSFRQTASQGQRKSLLFALKLAEFELLKQHKGTTPLLLLDDVFEKLDAQRMQHLLQWVCVENNGPVFITDTHRERLEAALGHPGTDFQLISLDEAVA
jgi:DNA replication and repair protein RecF